MKLRNDLFIITLFILLFGVLSINTAIGETRIEDVKFEYSRWPIHINLLSPIKKSGYGLQIGLIGNAVVGKFNGMQIGTLGNRNLGHFNEPDIANYPSYFITEKALNSTMSNGIQIGLLNYSSLRGIQIGLWNEEVIYTPLGLYGSPNNDGRMHGIQIGIFGNNISSLKGIQLGIINFSDEVHGVQIGFFNNAKSLKGLQIGLINMIDFQMSVPLFNYRF